jgi:MFS family permease
LKIQRTTVSVFFFFNGFLYANWASRLPELQDHLNISHSGLGNLLFILALGAVTAMPFTGWLAVRFGSALISKICAVVLCAAIAVIAFPQDLVLERIVFFIVGLSNGAMDVTMNEQAVLVERLWKKPIMSSFHALWSVGMAVGAGTGALFSRIQTALPYHLMAISAIGLLFLLWASRSLIKEKFRTPGMERSFVLPNWTIVPLGLVAFCGMLSEGSIADWSAIFMNKVIGESESFSALAFGTFGAAMTIGRLAGDYLTIKFGKKKLLIRSGFAAVAGLGIVLGFASVWATFTGFFLVGLGLSNVVPIIYTTAGNTPGISPSMGIAMATTIGYGGFFVGPPVIGYLADDYGLRIGLGFPFILLIAMLILIAKINFERFKT